VADFLKTEEDFTQLHLIPPAHLAGSFLSHDRPDEKIQELKRKKALQSGSRDALRTLTFKDPESLLDHVTENWQKNWVTTDIDSLRIVELYSKRPFFLLLHVDASVTTRFSRFCAE
jgi:hypothetical protein